MKIGNPALQAAIVTSKDRSAYRLTIENQNEPVPKDVEHVIVEEGITKIKANTFYKRKQLKSITFPQSLEDIGNDALANCEALKALFIPRNVTRIGKGAFEYCKGLRDVILEHGSTLESIHEYAFFHCTALKSIVMPRSVTSLGVCLFEDCHDLESAIFEKGSKLLIIPDACFCSCRQLKSIIIPNAVTIIEFRAFWCCHSLTSVYFTQHSNLEYIQEEAFFCCPNLQFINVPSNIISISTAAFNHANTIPITSTSLNQEQLLHWFQHGYDTLPLHQLCYRNIHALTQDKLVSIPNNDPSLTHQDECGLTPLHIVCSNPQATIRVIKHIYNKHPEAATRMVVSANTTPWHMYLVAKGVINCKELDAISNGRDDYEFFDNYGYKEQVAVSDIAKALLNQDATLNNIHSLIEMGLDYDVDGVYDVTLALHGVSSFNQEYNRISETSGLYPFMTMAVSNAFTLCHVYEMAMKTSAHNMQL